MEFEEIFAKLYKQREYADLNYVPIIRVKSAKYLYNYIKDNKIKTVLEIGTAIGYSGSIMLSAGVEHLSTIEINQVYYDIAIQTFQSTGFLDRVKMYLGDAKDVLANLCCLNKKYDMVFLDGAKGQYIRYLPMLKKMLNDNGVIFADNVLLQGLVEGEEFVPHKKRSMVVNLRKYLKTVNESPYKTDLIRLEDGIAITKVIGENV